MSYRMLGRSIPNEYISLSVLIGTGLLASAFGGGKSESKPVPQSIQQAKASVSISFGTKDEEEFIKRFIEEAEKENKH